MVLTVGAPEIPDSVQFAVLPPPRRDKSRRQLECGPALSITSFWAVNIIIISIIFFKYHYPETNIETMLHINGELKKSKERK